MTIVLCDVCGQRVMGAVIKGDKGEYCRMLCLLQAEGPERVVEVVSGY